MRKQTPIARIQLHPRDGAVSGRRARRVRGRTRLDSAPMAPAREYRRLQLAPRLVTAGGAPLLGVLEPRIGERDARLRPGRTSTCHEAAQRGPPIGVPGTFANRDTGAAAIFVFTAAARALGALPLYRAPAIFPELGG